MQRILLSLAFLLTSTSAPAAWTLDVGTDEMTDARDVLITQPAGSLEGMAGVACDADGPLIVGFHFGRVFLTGGEMLWRVDDEPAVTVEGYAARDSIQLQGVPAAALARAMVRGNTLRVRAQGGGGAATSVLTFDLAGFAKTFAAGCAEHEEYAGASAR